jgi:hypothetical protein
MFLTAYDKTLTAVSRIVDSCANKLDNVIRNVMKIKKFNLARLKPLTLKLSLILFLLMPVAAGVTQQQAEAHDRKPGKNQNRVCGSAKEGHVHTKINLGCKRVNKNPIIDMAFGIIRFLSFGVGIVVIASVVLAGVQYTTSEGNPEKTAQAKGRVQTSIIALVLYVFTFAIVQFLVPGGLF